MAPLSHLAASFSSSPLAFLRLVIRGLSTVWPTDLSPSPGCARLLCSRPSPEAFQGGGWCLGAAEQGSGFAWKPPQAPGVGAPARAELGGRERGWVSEAQR